MSAGPQLVRPAEPPERNWAPVVVATVVVLAVAVGAIWFFGHRKTPPAVTPISAPTDPYAANLAIGDLHMSESANLAGGKSTYLDGRIANNGSRTVTGIGAQVLFRDPAREVAWNVTQPMTLIRTREPYIDVEPIAAAPLKPGDSREFRLIFDNVPQDWDGAFPEIRIVRVDSK